MQVRDILIKYFSRKVLFAEKVLFVEIVVNPVEESKKPPKVFCHQGPIKCAAEAEN